MVRKVWKGVRQRVGSGKKAAEEGKMLAIKSGFIDKEAALLTLSKPQGGHRKAEQEGVTRHQLVLAGG